MTARRHISTLDGLRGLAAVAVMLGHIQGLMFDGSLGFHGRMAVDLFFALSGFVVTGAYEARMRAPGGWRGFAAARAARLWPMIVIGVSVGAVLNTLMFHPPGVAPLWVLAVLCIPHFWSGQLFPLNVIQWSLFYEILANACHCLFVRWLSVRTLAVTAALSLIALLIEGQFVSLGGGSMADTALVGLTRVVFGYGAGVLIYRLKDRLPPLRPPVWGVYLAAAAVFLTPSSGLDRFVDPILIAACPLIVWMGVGAPESGGRAARLAGALSYPLYLVHYPINLAVVSAIGPDAGFALRCGAGLGIALLSLGLAWAALPVERWARGVIGDGFRRRAMTTP